MYENHFNVLLKFWSYCLTLSHTNTKQVYYVKSRRIWTFCGRHHTWSALNMICVFIFDHVSFLFKIKLLNRIVIFLYFVKMDYFDAQGNPVYIRRWFGSLILPKSRKRVFFLTIKIVLVNYLINRICNSFSFILYLWNSFIIFFWLGKSRKNIKL